MSKKIIGITGLPGTGKTTVSRIFKKLGAYIIEADKVGHSVLRKNLEKVEEIIGEPLKIQGKIDKKRIREIIFENPFKRKKFNHLLHPKIIKEIFNEVKKCKKKYIVVDGALIFELGLDKKFDWIITVISEKNLMLERLKRKFQNSPQDFLEKVLKSQLPEQRKIAGSDFIIVNNNSLKELKNKAFSVWEKITASRTKNSFRRRI